MRRMYWCCARICSGLVTQTQYHFGDSAMHKTRLAPIGWTAHGERSEVGCNELSITVYTDDCLPGMLRRRSPILKKKHSESSVRGRRAEGSAKPIPDSQIDFSDIPESTTGELRRARRVGRPSSGMAKQLIAIRLSPRLLSQLRKMAAKRGKPYQTLIHELLEKAAAHAA